MVIPRAPRGHRTPRGGEGRRATILTRHACARLDPLTRRDARALIVHRFQSREREEGFWLGNPRGRRETNEGRSLSEFSPRLFCAPSRSDECLGTHSPYGLPLEHVLLPQFLKRARGYSTHLVGKWDVGHFHADFLPQRRGFDTFFGFYSSFVSYFSCVRVVVSSSFLSLGAQRRRRRAIAVALVVGGIGFHSSADSVRASSNATVARPRSAMVCERERRQPRSVP